MVIDSSAAVAFLLGGDDAEWVEDVIAGEGLHAPHLLDLEVANVLRGLGRRRVVTGRRASHALEDLLELAVHRYSHVPFVERIWQLRSNLSAYDASYVALAEALEAPLVTIDRRLAGAPGPPHRRAGGVSATVAELVSRAVRERSESVLLGALVAAARAAAEEREETAATAGSTWRSRSATDARAVNRNEVVTKSAHLVTHACGFRG